MRTSRSMRPAWRTVSILAVLVSALVPGMALAQNAGGGEHKLAGKTVAILVADGFEQVELTGPRQALEAAGAKTVLISPHSGQVRAWNLTQWGDMFDVNCPLDTARPEQFDALLLPGGVMNPDFLRTNGEAVQFARSFFDAGKPVASICHGPWTLINAGVVKGRRMTSWPSLKVDLTNAGADLGGQGGGGRRQSCHQPQAVRHPGLQPAHDRSVRRRPACRHFRHGRVDWPVIPSDEEGWPTGIRPARRGRGPADTGCGRAVGGFGSPRPVPGLVLARFPRHFSEISDAPAACDGPRIASHGRFRGGPSVSPTAADPAAEGDPHSPGPSGRDIMRAFGRARILCAPGPAGMPSPARAGKTCRGINRRGRTCGRGRR